MEKDMKKLFLILLLPILLSSCVKYYDDNQSDCAQVVDYGYIDCSAPYGGCTYWLTVQYPSGNRVKLRVDQYTWEQMAPGDYICI